MKELAALAYRDTTAENREFWKNEMGQALREIQQVYDDKLESMRSEMETFYNLKVIRPFFFDSGFSILRCNPSPSRTLSWKDVVRTSVFGWRTFPDLCLIYGLHVTTSLVRCPLWVNQPGQLSLPFLWGR